MSDDDGYTAGNETEWGDGYLEVDFVPVQGTVAEATTDPVPTAAAPPAAASGAQQQPGSESGDVTAPVSTLVVGEPRYESGGMVYVGPTTPLHLAARDDVLPDDAVGISVRVRVGHGPGDDGEFVPHANGAQVEVGALPDGPISIDLSAYDHHQSEATHTVELMLDSTPPVITITEPALDRYLVGDQPVVEYSLDDGLIGSGVESETVTFDGTPVGPGDAIDLFFAPAGMHTVEVQATDRLGNTGAAAVTFMVEATPEALLASLNRAKLLGLITDDDTFERWRALLVAADRADDRGRDAAEAGQLRTFVTELRLAAGKEIDSATSARFVSYADELLVSRSE